MPACGGVTSRSEREAAARSGAARSTGAAALDDITASIERVRAHAIAAGDELGVAEEPQGGSAAERRLGRRPLAGGKLGRRRTAGAAACRRL
jgi:hypothetical protein